MRLMIIFGSSRQGRKGGLVAQWVEKTANADDRFQIDYVDVRDLGLPFFDEPMDPFEMKSSGQDYINPAGKKWAERVEQSDSFIIVTPEYNHSYPAVLKNALDWVGPQWHDKPVAFVSYGSEAGGARSVEHLRQVVATLGMIQVSSAIHFAHFEHAFTEAGNPQDERFNKKLPRILNEIKRLADRK